MIIKNGTVFMSNASFQKADIVLKNDTIVQVCTGVCPSDMMGAFSDTQGSPDIYDASDCYVVPGFTDIHFHGCVGHDLCNGDLDGLHMMAEYELSCGITQICPATMTLSEEKLSSIVSYVKEYHDMAAGAKNSVSHNTVAGVKSSVSHNVTVGVKVTSATTLFGAQLVGINLEGPFISHAKKGAQNPDYIVAPDREMFLRLKEKAPSLIKLITIAPETENAMDFIEEFHKEIAISIGHTAADYQTAKTAFDKGAKHVTHLFNAMPPFAHRDAGVIGAAFDAKGTYVELICDGVHISDSVIRSVFALFGEDRVVLISDSMMAAGMPDGTYTLGGQPVHVKCSFATLEDGTLAGSVTNLMKCFLHAVSIGIPLESALKAVTINPARAIGVDDRYGSIEASKTANLLILNRDLSLRDVFFRGQRC